MREDFKRMKDELMDNFRAELDSRSFGSDGFFNTQQLMAKMDSFQENILERLAEKVNKTGEEYVSTSTDTIFDCENEINFAPDSVATFSVSEENFRYNIFYGKGKMRRAPVGYVFPKMDLCLLIMNWFCGNFSKKITPYCKMTGRDLNVKTQQNMLAKMRMMINIVKKAAVEEGSWLLTNDYIGNVANCNLLFESI